MNNTKQLIFTPALRPGLPTTDRVETGEPSGQFAHLPRQSGGGDRRRTTAKNSGDAADIERHRSMMLASSERSEPATGVVSLSLSSSGRSVSFDTERPSTIEYR